MIQYRTIPSMFLEVGDKFHRTERSIYLRKVNGSYQGLSYASLRELVEQLYMGLVSLGVEPGDRIGIVAENRVEWVASDFAILSCGAVDVPVFPTLTERQMEYIYHNCSASIIIVSNRLQLQKILRVREGLEALEHIIVMNDDVQSDDPSLVLSWSQLLERGKSACSAEDRTKRFVAAAKEVQGSDLCTIVYTSGTTGQPKGVMLTHTNLCSNINAINELIHVDANDIFLSYLPMCHSYERIAGFYIAFGYGAATAFAESLDTVRTNLKEIQPTIMTSVPRLFERIRNGVIANVEKQPAARQKVFALALKAGKRWLTERERGRVSIITKLMYASADALVFSKIRELTGGRLRFFVSGGGALAPDVKEFFTMLGMTILEGYGLTESSPVLSVTVPNDDEIGTVGKAISGVELQLADDGEILARGANIMRGYWNDPVATKEALDEEGWLHTGDIGVFTPRGNLKITDRKKNIFVSSGGKNIAPLAIENAVTQSKFVDQAFIVGEKREYCTALIVPDSQLADALMEAAHLPQHMSRFEKLNSTAVLRAVFADIQLYQRDLAKYERVRKITLLDEPFSVENGMMTPTLKVKRKVVEQHYAALIEQMYSGSGSEE